MRTPSFERIRQYTNKDRLLLEVLVSSFRSVATTSAVLAEASNLANKLTGDGRLAWYATLADFAVETQEAHVETRRVGEQVEMIRFGFTDAVLNRLASTHTVITVDGRFAAHLEAGGQQVINFNHLRGLDR